MKYRSRTSYIDQYFVRVVKLNYLLNWVKEYENDMQFISCFDNMSSITKFVCMPFYKEKKYNLVFIRCFSAYAIYL